MASLKIWTDEVELRSKLPIDLAMPKAYVIANTPFNENHWTRTFTTKTGHIVVARATQKLALSRNVELKIEARSSLDNVEYETIIKKIEYEIGLNETMKVFRNLRKSDTIIDIALQSNPGFRIFANSEAIETAILTIISQNTSFFTYLILVENMLKKYGRKVPWDPALYVFPDKPQLARMLERDWLSLKLGYKSKFLGALTENDLDNIETYAFYPILDRGLDGLKKIKGIGNYTARILGIYHSRRYDYAFYDTYVLEVLNHKYEIGNINNIKQFDDWVNRKWPKDPALVIHSLLLEYLPEFLKSHETFYSKAVKQGKEKPIIETVKSSKKIKKTVKTISMKKVEKKSTKKKTKTIKKKTPKAPKELLEKLTKKTLEEGLQDYITDSIFDANITDQSKKVEVIEERKTAVVRKKIKKKTTKKPIKKKPVKKGAKKTKKKKAVKPKPTKKGTKKAKKKAAKKKTKSSKK